MKFHHHSQKVRDGVFGSHSLMAVIRDWAILSFWFNQFSSENRFTRKKKKRGCRQIKINHKKKKTHVAKSVQPFTRIYVQSSFYRPSAPAASLELAEIKKKKKRRQKSEQPKSNVQADCNVNAPLRQKEIPRLMPLIPFNASFCEPPLLPLTHSHHHSCLYC
jgi:hypothetical protein